MIGTITALVLVSLFLRFLSNSLNPELADYNYEICFILRGLGGKKEYFSFFPSYFSTFFSNNGTPPDYFNFCVDFSSLPVIKYNWVTS